MPDISSILSSTKIALEKQAADKFGAEIESFARGTVSGALNTALGNPTTSNGRQPGQFYSSSYAVALSGATSYRPKLKFLFKIEFVFTPEAIRQFPSVLGGAHANDFTLMAKSVDRPKIDFEYEDDVNFYNFRSSALRKIKHRELTLTFLDDTGNRVLNFFRALMMIHSPITRRQLIREGGNEAARRAPPDPNSISTGSGMLFSQPGVLTADDNAIRGAVNSQIGNLIQTIRVKQMYVDPSEQLGDAYKEVIFDYLNARLVSFDLDNLSYEESAPNTMTLQFNYDWMEIVTVGSMNTPDGPNYVVTVPNVNGAPIDPMPVGRPSGKSQGMNNSFAQIINNQLSRGVGSVTSTAINRAVTNIAGNGRFATAIGSQVSNVLGGIVGDASRGVTGQVINQVNGGIASVRSSIIGPQDRTPGIVVDSATGGNTTVQSVVTSNPLDRFNPFK